MVSYFLNTYFQCYYDDDNYCCCCCYCYCYYYAFVVIAFQMELQELDNQDSNREDDTEQTVDSGLPNIEVIMETLKKRIVFKISVKNTTY